MPNKRKVQGKVKRRRAVKKRAVLVAKRPKKNRMVKGSIRGSGHYFGDIGRDLGSAAGGFLGNIAGNALGSIFGSGRYKFKRNSLMGASDAGPPVFRSQQNGNVTVSHREYIRDIVGSSTFSLTALSLNPGLVGTFPWLSQLASNFEEFDIRGLVFQYKPTSGSAIASTNNALGTVIMATNYDVDDAPFPDKLHMEAYQFSTSGTSCSNFMHPVECAPSENVLSTQYIRTTAVPTGQDARFYDLGLFQIATVGQQAAVTIGELWVSYEVELRKPRLVTPSMVASADHWTNSLVSTPTWAISASLTPGSSNITSITGNPSQPQTGYLLFFNDPGFYFVAFTSANAAAPWGGLAVNGGTLVGTFASGADSSFSLAQSSVAVMVVTVLITATGGLGYIQAIPTAGGGVIPYDVFVMPLPSGLTTQRDELQDAMKRLLLKFSGTKAIPDLLKYIETRDGESKMVERPTDAREYVQVASTKGDDKSKPIISSSSAAAAGSPPTRWFG